MEIKSNKLFENKTGYHRNAIFSQHLSYDFSWQILISRQCPDNRAGKQFHYRTSVWRTTKPVSNHSQEQKWLRNSCISQGPTISWEMTHGNCINGSHTSLTILYLPNFKDRLPASWNFLSFLGLTNVLSFYDARSLPLPSQKEYIRRSRTQQHMKHILGSTPWNAVRNSWMMTASYFVITNR